MKRLRNMFRLNFYEHIYVVYKTVLGEQGNEYSMRAICFNGAMSPSTSPRLVRATRNSNFTRELTKGYDYKDALSETLATYECTSVSDHFWILITTKIV